MPDFDVSGPFTAGEYQGDSVVFGGDGEPIMYLLASDFVDGYDEAQAFARYVAQLLEANRGKGDVG